MSEFIGEMSLLELYSTRTLLEEDTFVFVTKDPTWVEAEKVFLGPESVYDDCEETDCGTPDWIFDKGYSYGLLVSDIPGFYDMTWVANGGSDTFMNFSICLSNFVKYDSLTFPQKNSPN